VSTVYALLVGIDRYLAEPDVRPLRGCVNDVDDVLAMLRTTVVAGAEIDAVVLRDDEATRAAVIAGLRNHLTKAGPGDTALFWFSGHGAEEPAPEDSWVVEPTGLLQTLVCHDSRRGGVPDLWDKELSVLLDIAAERAGHVAAVLDSCHSEGGTREIGSQWRAAPPAPARDPQAMLPELVARAAVPARIGPEHVALSACRRDQKAEERLLDGVPHGLFTWSLLRSLKRLGSSATYRDLLAAARSEVAQQRAYRQVPQIYPSGSDLTDRVFLSRLVGAPATGLEMTYGGDGWQVDAGRAHGLPGDPAGMIFRVRDTGHLARVRLVRPDRCLVVPMEGWEPGRESQFKVALAALPRPLTTVAGPLPDGFSSAYVRPADSGESPDLIVEPGPGGPRVTDRRGDGAVDVSPDRLVPALEHMARWLRLLDLRNPGSALGEPIRLEIVPATPGDDLVPRDRPALEPDEDGAYHVRYEPGAPEIFIRLRNTSHRQLYVTLLDLTPRYGVHATLFPVQPIGPGRLAAALRGGRIRVSFPAGWPVEPGRVIRDRLVLVVAEQPFSADPYLLPALTETTRGTARDLGGAVPPTTSGTDWTVQRPIELVTEVSAANPAPGGPPDQAQ
jgi:hypothetical protein